MMSNKMSVDVQIIGVFRKISLGAQEMVVFSLCTKILIILQLQLPLWLIYRKQHVISSLTHELPFGFLLDFALRCLQRCLRRCLKRCLSTCLKICLHRCLTTCLTRCHIFFFSQIMYMKAWKVNFFWQKDLFLGTSISLTSMSMTFIVHLLPLCLRRCLNRCLPRCLVR